MSGRRSTPLLRRLLALSLASLLALGSASPAWAWGRTGHRVIAKLAERHLTDQAKAESEGRGPGATPGMRRTRRVIRDSSNGPFKGPSSYHRFYRWC
jgi:hypothetical protein